MIPGVEPILLDLENLFLLSVSLENLIFQGKNTAFGIVSQSSALQMPHAR